MDGYQITEVESALNELRGYIFFSYWIKNKPIDLLSHPSYFPLRYIFKTYSLKKHVGRGLCCTVQRCCKALPLIFQHSFKARHASKGDDFSVNTGK